MRTHDIAVVGAGIIGTSVARELQKRGMSCLLVDAGDPGAGTSFGNAGHIATEQLRPLTEPGAWRGVPGLLAGRGAASILWRDIGSVLPWGLSYLRACGKERVASATQAFEALQAQTFEDWQRLAAECRGVDELTRFLGHDEVFESDCAYRRALAVLQADERNGLLWRELTSTELASVRAITGNAAAGVRYRGSGYVRSPLGIVTALFDDYRRRGGTFFKAAVQGITAGFELSTDAGKVRANRVLIAAGSRSATLLRPFGLNVPLIAERGYHLSFGRHIPGLERPLVLSERSVVVTPMVFGFRSTSFVEFGSPGSPPNPAKWRRLARHLEQSGISNPGDAPDKWMGERPTFPDYLPAIGACRGHKGLFYAVGHQHLGLTLSASTARIAANLIVSGKRESFLDALDLMRFG